jgi:hypothetical protein
MSSNFASDAMMNGHSVRDMADAKAEGDGVNLRTLNRALSQAGLPMLDSVPKHKAAIRLTADTEYPLVFEHGIGTENVIVRVVANDYHSVPASKTGLRILNENTVEINPVDTENLVKLEVLLMQ